MKTNPVYTHMTKLAWRNVLLNWRHSLATLVAIAAGFVAICAFRGFIASTKENGLNNFSKKYMFGDVLVTVPGAVLERNANPWQNSLSKEDQDFLEDFYQHDPEFLRRVRFLSAFGMASTAKHQSIFMGLGYDLKEGAEMRGERYLNNAVTGSILTPDKPGVALGIAMAELLGCSGGYKDRMVARGNKPLDPANIEPLNCPDSRVTLTSSTEGASVNNIMLPVVGLLDGTFHEADRVLVNMSLTDAQKLLNTDKVSFESIKLKHPDQFGAFSARLEKAATARGLHLQSGSWRNYSIGAQLESQLFLLDLLSAIFGSIVIFICVMSVANTMMKSVNERTREIGTLRSLGFHRAHIVYMFALEGFFISILGCSIGLVATLGLGASIGYFNIGYTGGMMATPLAVQVSWVPWTWTACIAALAVLATLTSTMAARRAARMVIADAMRFS